MLAADFCLITPCHYDKMPWLICLLSPAMLILRYATCFHATLDDMLMPRHYFRYADDAWWMLLLIRADVIISLIILIFQYFLYWLFSFIFHSFTPFTLTIWCRRYFRYIIDTPWWWWLLFFDCWYATMMPPFILFFAMPPLTLFWCDDDMPLLILLLILLMIITPWSWDIAYATPCLHFAVIFDALRRLIRRRLFRCLRLFFWYADAFIPFLLIIIATLLLCHYYFDDDATRYYFIFAPCCWYLPDVSFLMLLTPMLIFFAAIFSADAAFHYFLLWYCRWCCHFHAMLIRHWCHAAAVDAIFCLCRWLFFFDYYFSLLFAADIIFDIYYYDAAAYFATLMPYIWLMLLMPLLCCRPPPFRLRYADADTRWCRWLRLRLRCHYFRCRHFHYLFFMLLMLAARWLSYAFRHFHWCFTPFSLLLLRCRYYDTPLFWWCHFMPWLYALLMFSIIAYYLYALLRRHYAAFAADARCYYADACRRFWCRCAICRHAAADYLFSPLDVFIIFDFAMLPLTRLRYDDAMLDVYYWYDAIFDTPPLIRCFLIIIFAADVWCLIIIFAADIDIIFRLWYCRFSLFRFSPCHYYAMILLLLMFAYFDILLRCHAAFAFIIFRWWCRRLYAMPPWWFSIFADAAFLSLFSRLLILLLIIIVYYYFSCCWYAYFAAIRLLRHAWYAAHYYADAFAIIIFSSLFADYYVDMLIYYAPYCCWCFAAWLDMILITFHFTLAYYYFLIRHWCHFIAMPLFSSSCHFRRRFYWLFHADIFWLMMMPYMPLFSSCRRHAIFFDYLITPLFHYFFFFIFFDYYAAIDIIDITLILRLSLMLDTWYYATCWYVIFDAAMPCR